MTSKPEEICLMVQLSNQDAWNLASGLITLILRSNAVDDEEAYRMQSSAEKVRGNLAAMWYGPR